MSCTAACAGAVARPALPGRPEAGPGGPVAEGGDDAAAEHWTRARSTAHRQIRMFPGMAWRRSGAPGRPDVHSPVDRRSKAPRRAGADIVRALPVGWLRLVT